MASPIPLAPPVTTTTRSRRLGYVANTPVLGMGFVLVGLSRHVYPAASDQKIQISPFGCLHHMLDVQLLVATVGSREHRPPFRATEREFLVRNFQMEPASRDIEFNDIAVADKCEGPARGSLRANMQNHRTVGSAAHARVGDANHIGDAASE